MLAFPWEMRESERVTWRVQGKVRLQVLQVQGTLLEVEACLLLLTFAMEMVLAWDCAGLGSMAVWVWVRVMWLELETEMETEMWQELERLLAKDWVMVQVRAGKLQWQS